MSYHPLDDLVWLLDRGYSVLFTEQEAEDDTEQFEITVFGPGELLTASTSPKKYMGRDFSILHEARQDKEGASR